jgi:hypothetical protein
VNWAHRRKRRKKVNKYYTLLAACCITACVPVDQLPPGSLPNQTAATSATSYPDVDPPFATVTSSHFAVHGYQENDIRPISVTAETIYSKISNDTGLFSPMSNGSYTLVVYKDQEEFAKKTKLPRGTRAAAAGTTIYIYPGAGLEPELAYELTALVLTNYLDRQAATSRWLIEGAALNQELNQLSDGERQAYRTIQANQLHINRVPFAQLTFQAPPAQDKRRTDIWYMQTESVVNYLFAQGSGLAFGGMMTSLRSGADIDQALAANYPGKFRSLTDLENAWKYTI